MPGKHFPQLQPAEQKVDYEGTAMEHAERHQFASHARAWGAAHKGPGIRFICTSDAHASAAPAPCRAAATSRPRLRALRHVCTRARLHYVRARRAVLCHVRAAPRPHNVRAPRRATSESEFGLVPVNTESNPAHLLQY